MASVNIALLVGNLGRDPEVRYTASGEAVCNFSIATTDSWKDKTSGEKKEATEWHNCSAFGKLAEICGEYLKKGSQVWVQGKLKTRKYTDKNGVEKYATEINVSEMKMLGSRQQGDDHPSQHQEQKSNGYAPQRSSHDDLGDDIPF